MWSPLLFNKTPLEPGLAERKLDRFTLAERKLDECIFYSDDSQQTITAAICIVLQAFQGRGRMTSSIPFLLVMQRISSSNVHVATNLVGDLNSRKA